MIEIVIVMADLICSKFTADKNYNSTVNNSAISRKFLIGAQMDIGNVKKTNQDSLSVKILNTAQGKMMFAVLCDGMGGLAKGEVASASVVRAFDNWVQTQTVEVIISSIGTYTGSMTDTFSITQAVLTEAVLSQNIYLYDGKAKTPSVTVKKGIATPALPGIKL